ncbi:MAG: helix-turn-helix transcriptional regulator [Lachnospira sp.]|nr:helix-turn-helix transcriptional regulator [Lachnospira sp.]
MATPLNIGEHIWVKHRFFNADMRMGSMEMATDHYEIGYAISGDRITITPTETYIYHAGNVTMTPTYMYHRTIPGSDAPYENYFIKFSPEFIQPFIDVVGQNVFNDLYEQRICSFTKETQPKIQQMFADMEIEYNKSTPYKNLILQGMLFRLFTTILENRLPEERVIYHPTPLTQPIVDAVSYIETHYDDKISLEHVAGTVHLSTAYFSRLFAEQLGIPYSEYLSNVRIRHAKVLLAQTDKSIMDIALETGFCNGDYLSTQFKKATGLTPSKFRKAAKVWG